MISFVIPTLNEESTIEETLRNLSHLSIDHEIILSDGGSTDRTLEIAKSYGARIVQHSGPDRQTIAEGRNQGSFLAEGEFIVGMDADTRFPNIDEFFSAAVDVFNKKPEVVGVTAWFRVYPEEETAPDRIIFWVMGAASMMLDNCLGSSCTCGGEFQMVRAEEFRKVGGYDQNLVAMEDVELFQRLRKQGRIYFHKGLYIYHSGRRAHILGWPHSIYTFLINTAYFKIYRRTWCDTWEAVR